MKLYDECGEVLCIRDPVNMHTGLKWRKKVAMFFSRDVSNIEYTCIHLYYFSNGWLLVISIFHDLEF